MVEQEVELRGERLLPPMPGAGGIIGRGEGQAGHLLAEGIGAAGEGAAVDVAEAVGAGTGEFFDRVGSQGTIG